MKTIKIIDILCYISVEEYDKLPKRIKDKWHTYTKIERNQELEWGRLVIEINYQDELGNCLFGDAYVLSDILNNEMEILDEEDEFEDIYEWGKPALEELNTEDIKLRDLQSYIYLLTKDLNTLIKNQKKIIERLKED